MFTEALICRNVQSDFDGLNAVEPQDAEDSDQQGIAEEVEMDLLKLTAIQNVQAQDYVSSPDLRDDFISFIRGRDSEGMYHSNSTIARTVNRVYHT